MQNLVDLTILGGMATSRKLISTADAASELEVDRSTLTRMVQAGKIRPAAKGEGLRGAMFFYASEVKRAKDRMSREQAA